MTTCDLTLHNVTAAGQVYLPALADLLAGQEQTSYALADVLHAQAWLLQCLERKLVDYAIVEGAFPALLTALGGAGDLARQITELRTQLMAIDQPGVFAGLAGHWPPPTEVESAAADLMPDEVSAAGIEAALEKFVRFSPDSPTEETN